MSVSQLSQVCRVEAGVIIMQIVVSVGLGCEGWAAQRVPANLLLVPGSCLTSAPATLTSPHLALLRAPLRGHLLCVCIR